MTLILAPTTDRPGDARDRPILSASNFLGRLRHKDPASDHSLECVATRSSTCLLAYDVKTSSHVVDDDGRAAYETSHVERLDGRSTSKM